jgi:hypothetical protein
VGGGSAAELSVELGPEPLIGRSLYFETADEWRTFLASEYGNPALAEGDTRVRARFELVPRRWVKLTFREDVVVRVSQYFQIDPRLPGPISTIRTFCRMYGVRTVGGLAAMLAQGLGSETTVWILALKYQGADISPRISCRIARAALSDMLANMVAAGGLSRAQQDEFIEVNARMRGSDGVYVSITPGGPGPVDLDFEQVVAGTVPELGTRFPKDLCLSYLKCRLDPDAREKRWVGYYEDAHGLGA